MTSARSKPKYVYVIGEPGSRTAKIGITVDLDGRRQQIQGASPVKIDVLWATPGSNALEKALHRHFATQRSHGEWFTFDNDPVSEVKAALADGLIDATPKVANEAEPQEPAADLTNMERMVLEGLRRRFPCLWFSLEEAAAALMCQDSSMREALDGLAQAEKVVAGPERPLFWRERQYCLVVGSRA